MELFFYILTGVLGVSLLFVLWHAKTRKTAIEKLQEYLLKIIYILSAPFVVVIEVCFMFMKAITHFFQQLTKLCLIPFSSIGIFCERLEETSEANLRQRLDHQAYHKKMKQGMEAYKAALFKDTSSFINLSIQTMVLLGTMLLQYVSFATTYRGISFYFQEMAFGAAAFITLVIQGSLLVLANALVHRQRHKIGRIMMLLYFMLTSMFFSYTGIVNQEISPEIDIRKNYTTFYKQYENLRNDVLSKATQTADEFSIDAIEAKIKNLKSHSESMRSSLEQSLQTNQAQVDASMKISYDEYGNPIYDTTQKDATLIALIDKQTQQIQRLKELDGQLKSKAIDISKASGTEFEHMDTDQKMKLLNDPATNYENVKAAYDALAQYMKSIDASFEVEALPATLGSYYRSFSLQKNLEQEKCLDYDTLRKEVTTRKSDMTNVSDILQLQSLITREITDNFINTDLADAQFVEDSAYYQETMKLADHALAFHDINLVALSRLRYGSQYFGTALFLLLLAIFVDGTTVLMPFFMSKAKKTILYANKRKDMRYEEEEILTDMLMELSHGDAALMQQRMDEFLALFEPVPYLQEEGYCLVVKETVFHEYLAAHPEIRELVIYLQHISYFVYTTKEMMQLFQKKAGLDATYEEHCYLLKTKFLIWMKQNQLHSYNERKQVNGNE